jgi:cysteinyl-tRNA synthetase
MTLRLYDTAARAAREFVPVTPGKVSIYLCGATVQAPPHIGHIRSGVSFDIARRWFEYRGYEVTFCRNVTDIDDKIINRAKDEGVETWRVAQRNEYAFQDAYRVLGCEDPTIEPRATGHIPEMIEMIQTLIERGHAYASGGDVYFRVRSDPEYGALSGRRIDDLRADEADDMAGVTHKKDPHDFTLWKATKPGTNEPSWDTPWGPGRPGWHLECSAMARRYLGEAFDIHGGGVELKFPHHENEMAQSHSCGYPFTAFWLHNGWVTIGGEKMSKSLGNSLLVSEMVRRVRPVVLRYYLGTPHYRSTIDYSPEALNEAAAAYGRIEGFVTRAVELVGVPADPGAVPDDFAASMDDDLGVPGAVAVLHNTVREGNTALAATDKEGVVTALASVLAMLDILGLNPLAAPWAASGGSSGGDLRPVVDTLVKVALEQRQAARERKDFAASDAIRDQLAASGITVEDTPSGPRWTVN